MQVCPETVNFALEVMNTIKEEQTVLQNSLHLWKEIHGSVFQSWDKLSHIQPCKVLGQLWRGRGGLAEIVKLVTE